MGCYFLNDSRSSYSYLYLNKIVSEIKIGHNYLPTKLLLSEAFFVSFCWEDKW